jgi:uncharacterized protein YndB with AHSA1/START domain
MSRTLTFVHEYRHPPERVWAALTDPLAIAEWLMPNDFAPVVGHRFQFRVPPQPGWNGIVDCEVLTVDPPRELAYSWKGDALDTLLRFTLEPTAAGTQLTVVHSGFTGFKATMISLMMGGGWKKIFGQGLPSVLDKLEQGEPLTGGKYGCSFPKRD